MACYCALVQARNGQSWWESVTQADHQEGRLLEEDEEGPRGGGRKTDNTIEVGET